MRWRFSHLRNRPAPSRSSRVREVATWDDDRKFDYEVCNEFVLDARHGVVAQASAGYRTGRRDSSEASHDAGDRRHAAH